jgi:predicted dehydrogenase
MGQQEPIRWGILGTANIARSSFLPGLRWAEGVPYAVAGRDLERTQQYAKDNGIERALEGYEALIADEGVDAIYNPLPNSLHAEWTIKALQAGKAVLCEKPLCLSAEETEAVLEVARSSLRPLWEAFVFPWRRQTERVWEIIRAGQVGEIREVHSAFTFRLRNRNNIRLDPALGGGALYDVGCYPTMYANMLFGGDPQAGVAMARWAPEGVDAAMQGVLDFPGERRLLFSCALDSADDTFTRLLGDEGQIWLSNPFHPREHDTLQIHRGGRVETEHPSGDEPSFGPTIAHIQDVLRGEAEPQHLAVDESLSNAVAIDLLLESAREGREIHVV